MTTTVEGLIGLALPPEPEHIRVAESAYALGQACQHAGMTSEPHKIPELSAILRNLENGDPIIAAAYSGYMRGWERASEGKA